MARKKQPKRKPGSLREMIGRSMAGARAMFQNRLGKLSSVNKQNLVSEAEWACKFLVVGRQSYMNQEWHNAIDSFFKSAVIATNIIFTANTHNITLPEKVVDDMNQVIHDSTHGIKKVVKAVAARDLLVHERRFHSTRRQGVAGVRHLMEVGG